MSAFDLKIEEHKISSSPKRHEGSHSPRRLHTHPLLWLIETISLNKNDWKSELYEIPLELLINMKWRY
jgi:hypothetical protein